MTGILVHSTLVHRSLALALLFAAVVLLSGASPALANTTTWTTSAGAVSGTSAIVADTSGNIYVYDPASSMVEKYTGTGKFLGTIGSPEISLAGLAASPDGGVYFGYMDYNASNYKVVKYDSAGDTVQTIVVPLGSGNGQAVQISAIGTDGAGNLYIFDGGSSRVEKLSPIGSYVTQWGSAGNGDGQFGSGPGGLAVASDGTVYTFDSSNRVQKFTSTGGFLGSWDSSIGPSAPIAVDSSGHVYVSSGLSVQEFDSSGRLLASVTSGSLGGVTTYGDDLVYTYGWSTVHRLELTVPDIAISLSAVSISVGQPLTATATASVPFGSIASYAFDFGTGGASTPPGPSPTAASSYAAAGSRQVTVRATSSRGGTATASAAVLVKPRAPVNVSRPSISGTAVEGERLTEGHGVWSYGPITGYRYQWERCDRVGHSCTAIGSATSQSYVPRAADVGRTIRVKETASSAGGAGAPATSHLTAVVKALPRVIALSVSPRTFRAAHRGKSVTSSPQLGTNVHYKLNIGASVRFTIRRALPGRQVGNRCVVPSRKNQNERRCTRYVEVRGSFTVRGHIGNNNIRFSGRLNGATLARGTYVLVATPTASTGTGRAQTTTLNILK